MPYGVRGHYLEDVALMDVMLGDLDLLAELLGGKARSKRLLQMKRRELVVSAAKQDALDLGKLFSGAGIRSLDVISPHARDEDDLLAVIVEADNLIEQHQVNVKEILMVQIGATQRGLCVLDVVVGEIAYQATGKRGETLHLRALVLSNNLTNRIARMLNLARLRADLGTFYVAPDGKLAVQARELKRRVEAQERVAAPTLIGLSAFQQKAVVACRTQRAQSFDSGNAIGKKLVLHRNAADTRLRSEGANLFQAWLQCSNAHRCALSSRKGGH